MEEGKKLTEEEFILQAIKKLRKKSRIGGFTASIAALTKRLEGISEPIQSRRLPDWLLRERSNHGSLKEGRCSFFPGKLPNSLRLKRSSN